ncbi:hypothetical protein TCAL_02730 [Tigriopus californicus]|uniref:Uncharacterized protein n=1 Tax=Tigriopus californicus TaxID=6832 RepID=A0A553NNN5_TIGCA|nr:uncharacterized protein LOC131879481 [Tigriopus californicus]XP_059081805.1 uncharacterized protein LOC131879481 [Tigriopus californicus]TRY67059.1 hypothetical protein TCAL_02730 [Tigriopus californicus]|eukprot:TCALIF_02730-PA protein Name:"Protein of unknown function" AED:0.07 eAED:0.05 QI:201/1/0.66/1/0.8/0.66/6/0/742
MNSRPATNLAVVKPSVRGSCSSVTHVERQTQRSTNARTSSSTTATSTTTTKNKSESVKLTYFGGNGCDSSHFLPRKYPPTKWNGSNFRSRSHSARSRNPSLSRNRVVQSRSGGQREDNPRVPTISRRFQSFLRAKRKPEIKQSDHLVLFDVHDSYFFQSPDSQPSTSTSFSRNSNPLYASFSDAQNISKGTLSSADHQTDKTVLDSVVDSVISRDTCLINSQTRVTGYTFSGGQAHHDSFQAAGSGRQYITEVVSQDRTDFESDPVYFSLSILSPSSIPECNSSSLIKMQIKKRPVFEGFTITVSPMFVQNIQCVNTKGELFSLLDPPNTMKTTVRFRTVLELEILMDPKYVVDVSYPTLAEAKLSSQINADSLVTPSLLNMTSYDANKGVSEEFFEEERHFESSVLNDPTHENKMSFDELGQVYTNISRKRILSKVQCSNIHFHAHNDGSTSVHRHTTCRKNSQAFTDPNNNDNNNTNNTSLGSSVKLPVQKEIIEHTMVVRHPSDLSNFSQQVERERYQGTLGKLTRGGVPQQLGSTYVSMPHSEEGHYSSLSYEEKQKKIPCECEDELDEMENGVKFNPFYVREMHQTTNKSGNRPNLPLNIINSGGLCQVLMDSVMHTSHVAAIHAEQSDCFQCREYMHKFRTGISDLGDQVQKLEHDEPRTYYDMQHSLDVERALTRLHYPALHQNSNRESSLAKRDRRLKMVAYFSVVFLFLIMLVIVIVVLGLYFHQQAFLNMES